MKENSIREIMVNDYRDIYLLNQDFNSNLNVFSEERVKGKIEIILKNTKDIIFVYEQNNKVIGYIHGSPYELLFSDSLVNVLGLVVKESYRNLGIGSMLIDRLEQWGKVNGFTGMKLLSHPNRINAHRLYQRHGIFIQRIKKIL
jgi:GNAT superfamily N-acetyltransferase